MKNEDGKLIIVPAAVKEKEMRKSLLVEYFQTVS